MSYVEPQIDVSEETKLAGLLAAYRIARETVVERGFENEIAWQASVSIDRVTESYFLREAAWVVLSSGMRESVIRKIFPSISLAFLEWKSAESIKANREECISEARRSFNNERKINAIAGIATTVADMGFTRLLRLIESEGIDRLCTLPYIGPITSYHLAKNIGLDVTKPDRHLVRACEAAGYDSPDQMCRTISQHCGDKVSVVDLVIWRYATINPNYLSDFSLDNAAQTC